jgi:hypothetical protein
MVAPPALLALTINLFGDDNLLDLGGDRHA